MKKNDNDPNSIAADIENFLNQGGMDTFEIPIQEIERMQKKLNVQPIRPISINVDDYKFITLEEMENDVPPKLEYIFHPCLPKQGIGWVYAKTGMGKTLFTLNLAYAIASGGSFLKYKCPKPRKLLYVDAEMSYSQLHQRTMEIRRREGKIDFPGNLTFFTRDKISPFPIPKIDTEEGQYFYKTRLLNENFEVVVFDNLSFLSSFDENKASEWKAIQVWLAHLCALNITVIMVHHAGKAEDGYRGTSAMMDGADVAISLQPVNKDSLEEETISSKKFKIVYGKNRNFFGIDALSYEVILQNGIWSFQSMEKSELDMVVEKVRLKITQKTIADELNCTQSKVAKLVKKAKRLGMLRE